jgi:CO/xanthine dehydrogenase Mo-binding subunit
VSMPEVIEAAAERGGWSNTAEGWKRVAQTPDPPGGMVKRGVGFACGFKNVGFSFGAPELCTAEIELHGKSKVEHVVLRHAGADVGQGSHTVMAQMAADAVGVPVEKVELIVSDTAQTGNSGSASASRLTFMAGNSIRGAAEAALEKWKDEERPAIARYEYHSPATSAFDPENGMCDPNFAYGYVAQVATVEVDLETGRVHLHDVVSANDVGKAINPQQVEGQVEGAVVQAFGYSVLEDFQQPGGIVQTGHLSTYLIPTILDIPDRVQAVILEHNDPRGPWGARGMAEMPYIPLAPAIAAAVHDALGIWYDEFPLLPERIVRGLGQPD